MNTKNRARIDRLALVWPTYGDPHNAPNEGDLFHTRFWSHPILPGVLNDHMAARARARVEAAGRCWFTGLTEAERAEWIATERNDLERLVLDLGEEAGWNEWHERGGALDRAAFDRHLAHAYKTADLNRADWSRPWWRKTWPEWQPGMTLDQLVELDALIAREAMARLAVYGGAK